MPPATNETMYAAAIGSPVGPLRLLASDRGVVAVLWPGDRRYPAVEAGPGHPLLAEAEGQLAEYFRGARREFTLPLDLRGTPFQRAVWQALRSIPYGATATYGGLAAALGRPAAARAVGAANGQNPLSIVVPCHRVVGAAGQLTGFAGGLETKALLLEHERGWDRKGGWDHGRGWDRKGGLDRKGGWDRKGRYVAVDAQGRLPL